METKDTLGKYKLEWIPLMCSEPMNGTGHGIEFHHKRGNGHLVIGFIEGFAWQKGITNQVRIYYLSPESTEWGEMLPKADDILHELADYVYEILEEKVPGKQREKMRTWVNG
jgi:hypothetical protein